MKKRIGWLIVGLLSLLLVCGGVLFYVLVFPTLISAQAPTISPTATITLALPDSTPTATPEPTFTFTPQPSPTQTLAPTATATATLVPTFTATAQPEYLYQIQQGSPKYLKNFIHAEQGCNWMGVIGQVLDETGAGVENQVVVVSGIMNGKKIEKIAMSGLDAVHGPGGYEIFIDSQLPEKPQFLDIQLFDLSGSPISELYIFEIPTTCDKGLIVINFNPKP